MANAGTGPPGPRVTPEPSDIWEARTPDGATFVIRRHGNPAGAAMVVSHANGLAVDAYHPFWSLLVDRFDLFVHDVRNHGWNPVGERRVHHVPQFTEDAEWITRSIDARIGNGKPRIGVFHSLSAMVALRHAAAGGQYAALVLFDPPECPAGGLPDAMEAVGGRLAEMTRRRKDSFGSPDELAAAFSRSPLFERMRPDIAGLLARSTVRRHGNGSGYEFRCPREYEAQVFEYFFAWSMTVDFDAVTCPVKILGSDPTVRNSFMPSMDLVQIVAVDYDFVPETSHFLPLEEPEECAARTLDFLEQHCDELKRGEFPAAEAFVHLYQLRLPRQSSRDSPRTSINGLAPQRRTTRMSASEPPLSHIRTRPLPSFPLPDAIAARTRGGSAYAGGPAREPCTGKGNGRCECLNACMSSAGNVPIEPESLWKMRRCSAHPCRVAERHSASAWSGA